MEGESQDNLDMVVIEWFDDKADASRSATSLVERGIAAVLDETSPSRVGVSVLALDVSRACELLGLIPLDDTRDDAALKRVGRPWLVPVLVFGLAMILVPLLAFFVSFKLSGG
ncbi:MAG: hypothetical protein WCK41_03750 [Actinomycetes bacterium]